jgi:non-specific serine/threonine protein kinase
LARRYFTALCHNPNHESAADLSVPSPGEKEWAALAEAAPPMKGLEYLKGSVLARLWNELEGHVCAEIGRTPGGAAAHLKGCNPAWNAAFPFAFLATYTHRLSEQGKVQHLPLGRALEEYAGAKNRAALSALLLPVQRAAEQSRLARELLDSRALFRPQLWRPEQAFAFLKDIPLFEQSGVVARIPDW